jgi:intermediate cleaving peptidase 55
VTPGVTKDEYAARRKAIIDSLPDGTAIILPSASHKFMSNDIYYEYRPNSDFYYYCGLTEPESLIVLEKRSGKPWFTLLLKDRDPQREIWDGPLTGVERGAEFFGADEVFSSKKVKDVLETILKRAKKVFYNRVQTDVKVPEGIANNPNFSSPIPLIEQQRLIKTPAEIAIMKKSGAISGEAFGDTMKFTRPGMSEKEVWAFIDYQCKRRGSFRLSYVPVVAAGKNALIIHYIQNNTIIKDGDMILVDAGGEYLNYASDITRTWPVNGKFTQPQLAIYNAVLRVQKACISLCKPGFSLARLHEASVLLMINELKSLKLLKTPEDYERFYPHAIGHYLGMDTHDVASAQVSLNFVPGMVVTVEPGLYIPDTPDVPEQYRGIGVRIEDDVVITPTGCEVLTAKAPKEPSEIEALIGERDTK